MFQWSPLTVMGCLGSTLYPTTIGPKNTYCRDISYITWFPLYIYDYIYTYILYTDIHIHICTYIYIYTYTYTYSTHIYIYIWLQGCLGRSKIRCFWALVLYLCTLSSTTRCCLVLLCTCSLWSVFMAAKVSVQWQGMVATSWQTLARQTALLTAA